MRKKEWDIILQRYSASEKSMDKYSLELLNKFTPLGVKDPLSLNWKKTSQSTRMGSVRPLCFCIKFRFLPHGPAEEPAWEVVMLTSILRWIAVEGGGEKMGRDWYCWDSSLLESFPHA